MEFDSTGFSGVIVVRLTCVCVAVPLALDPEGFFFSIVFPDVKEKKM